MTQVEALKRAVAGFCAYMRGLPEHAVRPKAAGPREVLAHLVFWHDVAAAQVVAHFEGHDVELPRGTIDELNAQAVAESRTIPLEVLVNRLEIANRRITARVTPETLGTVVIYAKKGATPRTLDRWMAQEANHINGHLKALLEQVTWDANAAAAGLREAVADYTRHVQALPAEALGAYSPYKEALSVLVNWFESALQQIDARQRGGFFHHAGEETLNMRIGHLQQERSVEALLLRLNMATARLGELAPARDPHDTLLEVHAQAMQRGKVQRTLDDFIDYSTRQVKAARRDVQQYLERPD